MEVTSDFRIKLVRSSSDCFVELHTLVNRNRAELLGVEDTFERSISHSDILRFSQSYRRNVMDFIESSTKRPPASGSQGITRLRLALKYWYFAEMVYFYPWSDFLAASKTEQPRVAKKLRGANNVQEDTRSSSPSTFVEALALWLFRYFPGMRQLKSDMAKLYAETVLPVGTSLYWDVIRRLLLYHETASAAALLEEGVRELSKSEDDAEALERQKSIQLIVKLASKKPRFCQLQSVNLTKMKADDTGVVYSDASTFLYHWGVWSEQCKSYCQAFPAEVIGYELRRVLLILAGDEDTIARHSSNWLENFLFLALYRDPLLTPDRAKSFLQSSPRLYERISVECSAASAVASNAPQVDEVFLWTSQSSLTVYRLLLGDILPFMNTLESLDSWACAHLVDLFVILEPKRFALTSEKLASKVGDQLFPINELLLLRFVEQQCLSHKALYKTAFEYLKVLLNDPTREQAPKVHLAEMLKAWISYTPVVVETASDCSVNSEKLTYLLDLSLNLRFYDTGVLLVCSAAKRLLGVGKFVDSMRLLRLLDGRTQSDALAKTVRAYEVQVVDMWLWRYFSVLGSSLKFGSGFPSLAADCVSLKHLHLKRQEGELTLASSNAVAEFMYRFAEYHKLRDSMLANSDAALGSKCVKLLFTCLLSPFCPTWAIPSFVLELIGYADGSVESALSFHFDSRKVLTLEQLHDVLFFLEKWRATSSKAEKSAPTHLTNYDLKTFAAKVPLAIDIWNKRINDDFKALIESPQKTNTFSVSVSHRDKVQGQVTPHICQAPSAYEWNRRRVEYLPHSVILSKASSSCLEALSLFSFV